MASTLSEKPRGLRHRAKRQIRNLLGALGYEIRGTHYIPRPLRETANLRAVEFDDIVCRRMVETRRRLTFVQVGAYDGVTRDPLRKYIKDRGWRGVMIEPQGKAIDQLRTLYKDTKDIVILHAAVGRTPGSASLYTVNSTNAPAWVGGLASLDRECILKHRDIIPGLHGMIGTELVPCIVFEDILAHLPDDTLDLLQIDTEGADAHILSLFPFERIKPAIVHWEVKHLSMADREACLARLQTFGYRFALPEREDMLAVL